MSYPCDIGDPITEYRDRCGCVWRNGKRVKVCPKHRHKNGIRPHIDKFPRSVFQNKDSSQSKRR